MNSVRQSYFTALIFLISLFALLFNDFYLKQTFHNTFTGKLSDFAGLMIFPWFWSLVFQKKAKLVYWGTAVLFVFWKLELSSSTIEFINQTTGIGLARVVDLTDLFALSVLPISFYFLEQSKSQLASLNLAFKYGFAGICFFAFIATSAPKIFVEPDWEFNNSFTIPLAKKQVLQERMRIRNETTMPDSLVLKNNKFRLEYYGGTYRFAFTAEILEKDSLSTELTLLKLLNYTIEGVSNEKKDVLDRRAFMVIFENEVLSNIKSSSQPPLTSYSILK